MYFPDSENARLEYAQYDANDRMMGSTIHTVSGLRISPGSSEATMDIESLAEKYKGKVTFWGEIDRQHVLPFGTPDDVREAVTRVRRALDDGNGGLIGQCEWGKDDPGGGVLRYASSVCGWSSDRRGFRGFCQFPATEGDPLSCSVRDDGC